jgi:hypothetical protein
MSASEASLYKAVGSFDLSGQSSPLTVSNSKIELGSEVLAFLKTERGTVSGVSIQNIQQGSFQAVFNTANDSIYSYLCVPPVYKFYADENPINPVNPDQRIINFIGTNNTVPPVLLASQTFTAGSYSIGANKTCTSITFTYSFVVFVPASTPSPGSITVILQGGTSPIPLSITASANPPAPIIQTLTGTINIPSAFLPFASTTGSPNTFTLTISNDINAGGGGSVVLYDSSVSPVLISSCTLVANYSN